MRRLALAAAVLAALAVAPAASAKLCVTIKAAPAAKVGEPVTIVVRAFLPRRQSSGIVGREPISFGTMRVPLTATGPGGRVVNLLTRARGGSRVGRISFPAAGTWRIFADNWAGAPASCAGTVRIRVS